MPTKMERLVSSCKRAITIDGRTYRLSTSWSTKARARKEAKRIRKTGYYARVFKDVLEGYGVFVVRK